MRQNRVALLLRFSVLVLLLLNTFGTGYVLVKVERLSNGPSELSSESNDDSMPVVQRVLNATGKKVPPFIR
jgi:hypothetical protein